MCIRSIQSQQQAIVEVPGVIEAIFVTDERIGDGTHLKVKEFEHEPVFENETASSP